MGLQKSHEILETGEQMPIPEEEDDRQWKDATCLWVFIADMKHRDQELLGEESVVGYFYSFGGPATQLPNKSRMEAYS